MAMDGVPAFGRYVGMTPESSSRCRARDFTGLMPKCARSGHFPTAYCRGLADVGFGRPRTPLRMMRQWDDFPRHQWIPIPPARNQQLRRDGGLLTMPSTSGETNVQGNNGTWTFHIDKNPGNQADKVTITFVPNPGGICKDIRLIQIVSLTALDRHGVPFKGMPENMIFKPGENPFTHRAKKMVRDRGGDPWTVDYRSCEADPYYNGDDAFQDIGTHGADKSDMWDTPGSDFTDVNLGIDYLEMNFQTCAICAETGQCLGCLKWRATAHRGGKEGECELIDPLAADPCSDIVQTATQAFVKTHSKVNDEGIRCWYCPDDDRFGPEISPKAYKKFMDAKLALRQMDLSPYREDMRMGKGTLIKDAGAILAAARVNPEGIAMKFTWGGTQSRTVPSLIFSAYELTPEDVVPFLRDAPRMGNDFVAMRNLVTGGSALL